MSIKDGGPAFPVQDVSKWQAHGMTLRDYFAAKAMWAIIIAVGEEMMKDPHEKVAFDSYRFADAMLKAREEG